MTTAQDAAVDQTEARKAEDMVAEYDTGARVPRGWQGRLLIGLCIVWSLFQLYIASALDTKLADWTGVSFFAQMEARSRFFHLAFGVALASIAFPLFRRAPRDRIPLYDAALAILGVAACSYGILFAGELAERAGNYTVVDQIVASVGLLVLFVCVYRSLGLPLVIIAGVFLIFALFGNYWPWLADLTNYGGNSVKKVVTYYWLEAEGVFGTALGVSATTIFLFVLFGALLDRAGGGNWFIKVAVSLLGALRGGPAKASVAASAMTGMISGSSIANTVTTGTFTIPLMKRIGLSKEKAGAVEVASSTNGQLTPPVMGAAAFLMVEYAQVSYIEVMQHAILPALISYIALLYIVHLEALKLRLTGLQKDGRRIGVPMIFLLFLTGFLAMGAITAAVVGLRLVLEDAAPGSSLAPALGLLAAAYIALVFLASRYPDLQLDDPNAELAHASRLTPTLLSGLYFALPIFVLVWNLMIEAGPFNRLSPSLSAFWATITIIIVMLTHRPLKALFRGESTVVSRAVQGGRDFVDGLVAGARNMIGIAVATGAAGIIVGTLGLTGGHQFIGAVIETVAGGNLMLLLFLVAVLCLILGMGLPTTANYLVVALLMAPVIVEVGAKSGLVVPLIAVHLFVFYFGILADDTPPVGLAAYAAAAISRGDPIKTGVQGFAYDIRTALLPFMFIFNTDLLLIDVTLAQAGLVFVTALIAMLCFAAATQGYFFAKNRIWETAILLLIAFSLFRPDFWLDRVLPPLEIYEGTAAVEAIGDAPEGSPLRLVVSGLDFDTREPAQTTLSVDAPAPGEADARLSEIGLTLVARDDGVLALEQPGFFTPFDSLRQQFRFDDAANPVALTRVEVVADRPPKELFFIPALLLLAGLILVQSRRATQPAF